MVANTERLRSTHGDLFTQLRSSTSSAHRELEHRLKLLKAPVSGERFTGALKQFAGFHWIWEPALAALPLFAPLARSRRRLPLLRRDLGCLGVTPDEFETLPRCAAAADLLVGTARAIGSMYVMEGSTLGGTVVSRAVAGADWLPEGGLFYFSPPQRDVHADWRELNLWATETWPESQWAQIEDGAHATFALLTAWMGGVSRE